MKKQLLFPESKIRSLKRGMEMDHNITFNLLYAIHALSVKFLKKNLKGCDH